jgi:hypothetical protein
LNIRSALLGLFVALTILLASTTVYESGTRTTTLTSISTLTSALTRTSTVTGIGTSTIVPLLSQNPSIAITSTKLIVATPDLCIIYNATVLNNSTEPVDNITMAFQNYSYHSHVTTQNPLSPGQSTSFSFCYNNNDINTSSTEPPPLHLVLIYGTFEGNQPFAFIERIGLAWTDGTPI